MAQNVEQKPGFVEGTSTTVRNLGIVGAIIGLLAMAEALVFLGGLTAVAGEVGRRATKKETVVYQAKTA